ncbi:GIY-YIG nuclease family protein [Muricauda sp. CAU 1633]|uniref:GIY-YIG nuclease family protein n=1 Tax=Allomuricauda sp. CAU 1633 TaxID=2816036 RepID=UPI001A90168D|nr:GIY-YIG nuclease family protein [Muricauda sp. CAU 1633]MBO0321104.1 GIY-YIG nuclease family protein [Muricauda sp. CAU 1633]
MEYFVYIIYSKSADRYYVGHCQDLEDRMSRHNGGRSKYTKLATDWEVKHTVGYSTRVEAMAREREIKRKKSRKYIEFLIAESGG